MVAVRIDDSGNGLLGLILVQGNHRATGDRGSSGGSSGVTEQLPPGRTSDHLAVGVGVGW
jgi:hypothetical protein